MNGKIVFTALLMSLLFLIPSGAEAHTRDFTYGSEPPYKYMQKGIKTKLEDVKPAKSSKTSPSANASGGKTQARSSGKAVSNGPQTSAGEFFAAVKTNIACYAGAVANIGAEVQLHPHVTLDMPMSMSFWDMERAHGLRLILFQPEVRYWFGHAGSGHFMGLHAGYSLRISDHWNFEFNLGAGYANMKYDRFYNIDNGAQSGGGEYDYWGITRLGLSLVYKF